MHPNQNFTLSAKALLRQEAGFRYFLLYMDFRNFQSINHYCGTSAGDRLLSSLTDYLEQAPDICLHERIFSDCFLAVLRMPQNALDQDACLLWGWHLEQFLSRERATYRACLLRVSCGICPVCQDDVAQAIDCANMARKEAKQHGSWMPRLFHANMRKDADQKHHLELELRTALHENQFCFFLQPQVSLLTGEIVGAEALTRRIGKDGEMISPSQFLAIMEDFGAVVELDLMILRQVCSYMANRMEQKLPVVRTAVNLSRLHAHNPSSAAHLDAIAREYAIPPELLEFELTETVLLEEITSMRGLVEQLRTYGYTVTIDDFGSGYAGINLWRELDFDCLKLDRQFLSDDADLKTRHNIMMPNLINIARQLHIQIVCEGVLTKEQCGYVRSLGCSIGQGFYFSAPLSPDDFYRRFEELDGHYPLSMI